MPNSMGKLTKIFLLLIAALSLYHVARFKRIVSFGYNEMSLSFSQTITISAPRQERVSLMEGIQRFGDSLHDYFQAISTNNSIPNAAKHTFDDPSCGFGAQKYRTLMHHEGLPQLYEVFHTDDSVYFGAVNPGVCEPEWRDTREFTSGSYFYSYDQDIQFICEFEDGTNVTSDAVPPVEGLKFKWTNFWSTAIVLIRCDIPDHLKPPESTENNIFKVSLHATVDLEPWLNHNDTLGWKYPTATKLGSYHNLRVCPREWPQLTLPIETAVDKKDTPKKKRRTLSMVTQIRLEYKNNDRKTITIPPVNVVAWIEYHLLIGFEHFYIFDHDDKQHGPLELLLAPYIQLGLVTYVWYPMQNCFRKSDDSEDGSLIAISQAMLTNTALRRYEHETEFMAHFDVDEFLQLPSNVNDVRVLLKNMTKSTMFASEKWYHECDEGERYTRYDHSTEADEVTLTPAIFPLSRSLCVSKDPTPGKSIMRTKDILGFFVHHPHVTTTHKVLNKKKDLDHDKVFLAHLRKHRLDRDKDKVRNGSHRRPFVQGPELQSQLEFNIKNRMAQLNAAT